MVKLYASSGVKGRVVDLDTGATVRGVRWVDVDERGEGTMLEAYFIRPDGSRSLDAFGNPRVYVARGRFRVSLFGPTVKLGAPKCAKCPSTLTLVGDDLCAACRAKERGQRHKMRVDLCDDPFDDHKCCECSRRARWSVSDEVEATPAVAPDAALPEALRATFAWERGATVARRWYCDRCYSGPRLLDSRGEVIRTFEDGGGARPQWHS